MDKIKIGNSVSVTWQLSVASAKGQDTLTKDKLKVYLRSAYQTREVTTYSLEENVVSFIFAGEEQKYTGPYDLIGVDTHEGKRLLLHKNAFGLVSYETEEAGKINAKDSEGNYVVKLNGEALTIKDVTEDAGVYARLVNLEELLKENHLVTDEEKALLTALKGQKEKVGSLPDQIVTEVSGEQDAEKFRIEVSTAEADGGYEANQVVMDIESATKAKAGLMSAADKAAFDKGKMGVVKWADLDSLHNIEDTDEGEPSVLSVVLWGRQIGVLAVFADNMEHVVTQVMVTNIGNMTDMSHYDDRAFTWIRIYNHNASHGASEEGTWSAWTAYVDGNMQLRLTGYDKQLERLWAAVNGLQRVTEDEIDEMWNG